MQTRYGQFCPVAKASEIFSTRWTPLVLRELMAGGQASRTIFRIMWLVLERAGVDVCVKDPGVSADPVIRGNIADYVAVYLGHAAWREKAGRDRATMTDHQFAASLDDYCDGKHE